MATSISLQLVHTAALILVLSWHHASAFHYPKHTKDMEHQPSSLASSVSSSASSFSELRQRTLTAPETSLRAKRISQMSCHCCSNSFNSHCCLKCMQRVGKRSNVFELPNSPSPLPSYDVVDIETFLPSVEDQPRDSALEASQSSGSYDDDDVIEIAKVETVDKTCLCCLQQMRETPEISSWTCCFSCYLTRQ